MRKANRPEARLVIRSAVAEALESRRLLAGIEAGVLVARGTTNADTISVRRTGTDDVIVTTNGVNQTFDMDNFTGVRLEGLGGNDTFNLIDPLTSPVVRNTTVLGGAGSDTISYAARSAALNFRVDPADSTMTNGSQVDRFTGVETIVGGSGNDRFLYGNINQPDQGEGPYVFRLEGRGGNDAFTDQIGFSNDFGVVTLMGGDGDDYFSDDLYGTVQQFGEGGNDTFRYNEGLGSGSGGNGIDTIDFAGEEEVIDMTRVPDIENVLVDGVSHVTRIIGNDLPNRIDASAASAEGITISGGNGGDTLIGGEGNDSILGEGGNDSLVGNAGNDTLDGGPGTDTLTGGPGDDTLLNGEVTDDGGGSDPTAPAIAINGGVLVASGTGGNDTFSIRRHLGDNVIVTVNALSREFDMDDFTGVRLEGLGGNDTFNLIDPLVSPVVRNTTVLGGAGNDTTSYATRTGRFDFGIDPNGSHVTGGPQTDQLDDVETIIGGSGDDVFAYSNGFNLPEEEQDLRYDFRIEGRGGNDRFISGLVSTISRDVGVTLFGGDGNDFFEQDDLGGRVFAEAGNDTIAIRSREANYANFLDGGSGVDLVIGAGGNRSLLDLREYPNIENADVSDFAGTVIGNALANRIDGTEAEGPITINGLGGNDTLIGGDFADSLDGGEGNDTLVGNAGNDTLNGGNGTDFADGGAGQNSHISIEQFAGGAGSIAIVSRVLTASGTGGNDTIRIARTGTDDVVVTVGSLSKQFDMDDFDGVLLQGLGGNDLIDMTDPVTAGTLTRKVTLDGGAGDDYLYASDGGDDVLRGGDGNDTLLGIRGDDALFGGAGNDNLYGGGGVDFMDGGDNDDYFEDAMGEPGDTFLGGNGNDTAQVDPGDEVSGVETITP